jgi:hypothetical protein
MPRTPLSLAEANLHAQQLSGLPVSLPWKGFGSALFLELGALEPPKRPRQRHQSGEACIYVGCDWRVEEGAKVIYGSSTSRPTIDKGIEGLRGVVIDSILIHGQVPELLIQFANGQRLMSAMMAPDGSEWSIRFREATWLACYEGVASLGDGSGTGMSDEEELVLEHSHQTAKRWGVPGSDSKSGRCNKCRWWARIDGEADFLDYGVCTASESQFDGRAVNLESGCEAFSADEI